MVVQVNVRLTLYIDQYLSSKINIGIDIEHTVCENMKTLKAGTLNYTPIGANSSFLLRPETLH